MNDAGEETVRGIDFAVDGEKKGRPVRLTGTIYNQFAMGGRWIRGDVHCHLKESRWDDDAGNALDFYGALGYDFIAGMEHDRIIALPSRPDLLVVPGAEVSPGHFLAFGLDDLSLPEVEGDRVMRTAGQVRVVKERGGIAILAHPFKSGWTWEGLNTLCDAGLDGIEVVNSNVRGKIADTGRADQIWGLLLQAGRELKAFGGDDAHGPHEELDPDGWGGASHAAWTGALVGEFSAAGLLAAFRGSRTYASEGPIVHSVEFHPGGRLVVGCSPCVACHFRSGGGSWGGSSSFPADGERESEEFVLDLAVRGYRVRDSIIVILQDARGRRAWMSPIPIRMQVEDRP